MKKFMFYTGDGLTETPTGNNIENYQILTFIDAENITEAMEKFDMDNFAKEDFKEILVKEVSQETEHIYIDKHIIRIEYLETFIGGIIEYGNDTGDNQEEFGCEVTLDNFSEVVPIEYLENEFDDLYSGFTKEEIQEAISNLKKETEDGDN